MKEQVQLPLLEMPASRTEETVSRKTRGGKEECVCVMVWRGRVAGI